MTRRVRSYAASPATLLYLTLLGLPALASAQVFDPFAGMELDPGELAALEPRAAAAAILREMQDRDRARKSDIAQYAVRSHTSMSEMMAGLGLGDQGTLLLHEKVTCPDPAGNGRQVAWRTVPPAEVRSRLERADTAGLSATAADLREAAEAQSRQSGRIDQQLASEGVPVGLLSGLGAGASRDAGMNVLAPSDFQSSYSLFFDVSPEALDAANDPNRTAAACAAAGSQMSVNDQARYAGQETVDGRTAVLVEVAGIDSTEAMGDGTDVTIDTATLVVDARRAVPLSMRFVGTVNQRRDSRPIMIERKALDYRNVPGSDMYESYRQVLSIDGWNELGPDAAEAQKQLAELEKQLASVPEAQRQMMERMLGSQLEMVRKMAGGGAFEFEVVVDEIVVDPGIPGPP